MNIIRTDSSDKPSTRYEKVLFSFLEKEGYKYSKSKNEFTQDFELGKRLISLSYDNSFGYISSVQYFIKIIFVGIEKIFKKIYPDYGWTNWTIHLNLHWTEGWLCNRTTGEYSDVSINSLAQEFLTQIKPTIDRVFGEITTYEDLHRAYNSNPHEFSAYVPSSRLERRIIIGLILTKAFEPAQFEQTKIAYLGLMDKYKGNDIGEIREEVSNGLNYIESNSIALK